MRRRGELRRMRWWSRAPARRAGGSGRLTGRRIACAGLAAGLALAIVCTGSGAADTGAGTATTFTGYAFDACNAPKPEALQAWLASPYRAIGIYIGGVNRACANVQLTPQWTAEAVAMGWNLIPLYVGLQAPCASRAGVAKIEPASASAEGTAAADDAAADAAALALPAGSPIYFDMEGYALDKPACSQAVEAFSSAWVTELHAQGFLAGVYGSASSTMRDLQAPTVQNAAPDDVWIADWNGQQTVFGNPYVSDQSWTNHQRLHQYRGGHRETWGGITIDVDSSVVDAAVVGATGSAPLPVLPAPVPTPTESAAGSLKAGDGIASVAWPAGAFDRPVVVSLTPSTPSGPVPGFGRGGYDVQLQVQQTTGEALGRPFAQPLTIHIGTMPGDLAPMRSSDGATWKPLQPLTSTVLPVGASAGYLRNPNGSVDIETASVGYFALLPETHRPPAPATLVGHFEHGRLVLQWPKTVSASGPAVSYQVTLTNRPVLSLSGPATTASLGSLRHSTPSVFRVVAIDAAGKVSVPSKPVVVLSSKRPAKLPKALPGWAWDLFDWQQNGKSGPRPTAPRIVPSWYWRWAAWRAAPFHFRA